MLRIKAGSDVLGGPNHQEASVPVVYEYVLDIACTLHSLFSLSMPFTFV